MACENEFEEDCENLRRLLYCNRIVEFTIKQIECTPGSHSGDNYMSVVKRLQITSQDSATASPKDSPAVASGPQRLSLIIKRQIPNLSRRQLYRCDEAFRNEISAYQQVVPLLERYTTITATEATPFPKCLYAGRDDYGEIILLQDLTALGYRMQSRLAGLSYAHCELVMKQLAKLHAASIAAKHLDSDIFREKCKHIREIVYCAEAEEFYRTILETSIQEALDSLRTSNVDGCLTEPIRLIEKLRTKLFRKIQACITNPKESLSVVCHGDLWVNNVMFAMADGGEGDAPKTIEVPGSVRFFDLQAMRYTSLVFDILHFFYTSTKRDLRDAYTKALLETYCAALDVNLEAQFTAAAAASQLSSLRDTFSLANIMEEYYGQVLYGLAISMWILPAVTFDPDDIPNLDVISELNADAKEFKCTQKLTPEYHSRLKDLALEFYQNGFLDTGDDD